MLIAFLIPLWLDSKYNALVCSLIIQHFYTPPTGHLLFDVIADRSLGLRTLVGFRKLKMYSHWWRGGIQGFWRRWQQSEQKQILFHARGRF